MLKCMTKEQFKLYIDEYRFAVEQLTPTKFKVMVINYDKSTGTKRYRINQVINNNKTGLFIQNGGGYDKSHACIDDIAWYLDNESEEKDSEFSCIDYLMKNQHFNNI